MDQAISLNCADIAEWFFYVHHTTDRIAHTKAFVTPVVEHWLEREIAIMEVITLFSSYS